MTIEYRRNDTNYYRKKEALKFCKNFGMATSMKIKNLRKAFSCKFFKYLEMF